MNKKISRLLRARKALSPVIATVILVAVTIVVAVSVAFWMGSIAGTYTAFEQVQITSTPVYKISNATGTWWNVTINMRNTGSADATIDNVLVNDKPYDSYSYIWVCKSGDSTWTKSGSLSISISAGSSETIVVSIKSGTDNGVTFAAGNTIDVKMHSAAGKEYPQIVTLS